MLEQLISIRGVKSAALLDADGTLIESVGREADLDAAALGRAAAKSLSKVLGDGEFNEMVIDFENGPMLLTSLGNQTLVTNFDDVSSLGRLRYSLKRFIAQLR